MFVFLYGNSLNYNNTKNICHFKDKNTKYVRM